MKILVRVDAAAASWDSKGRHFILRQERILCIILNLDKNSLVMSAKKNSRIGGVGEGGG